VEPGELYLPSVDDISFVTTKHDNELEEFTKNTERTFSNLKGEIEDALKTSTTNKEDLQKVKEDLLKSTFSPCQVEQDILVRCKQESPLLCKDYLDSYLSCINRTGGQKRE
jgi:hypothetical protein